MSIDSDLTRIAVALEQLVLIASNGEAPAIQKRGPGRPVGSKKVEAVAPVEPETATVGESAATEVSTSASSAEPKPSAAGPATTAEVPDVSLVKARVKTCVEKGVREAVLKLVTKHGGESASTIPEANRAAFLAESAPLAEAA